MKFELQITFHGDIAAFFLPPRLRAKSPIVREMHEKASVKDVIEACGVPHPEVDLIVIDSATGEGPFAADFRWQVEASSRIDLYGFPAPREILPWAPRLQTSRCERFVVDGHLGKLSRNLRLLGCDTFYEARADDRRLLEIMSAENRAILTRDRRLLMHSVVQNGFCPRSSQPEKQTIEVLRRFGLYDSPGAIAPFTRCLECNGLLMTVRKQDVLKQLAAEPRTLLYYDDYRLCAICGRIYWEGSHLAKLAERVSRLLAQ